MTDHITQKNPLGYAPVGGLLRRFAIPSIVAMLVGALYNIIDQFFIGQSIGELGNAATNVAFPLTTICTATALLWESVLHPPLIWPWDEENGKKHCSI